MNDSIPSANGATIELAGRACRWSHWKLRDYLELEQWFAASRPDPMVVARARLGELPETLQRHLLELAFEEAMRPTSPTVDELRSWLLGIDGLSTALEISLRDGQSNLTADECRRAVYEAGNARCGELRRVITAASGIELMEGSDEGNGPSRSACSGNSTCDDEEPDWIGDRYATD